MADNARWWEHYYVRYFVGTAFAIPLLLMISHREPWKTLLAGIENEGWLTAGAIAVGGLAFCYIASTPILLLHAMRWGIPSTAWTYRLVVVLVCVCLIVAGVTFAFLRFEDVNGKVSPTSLVPYVIVVILQLVFLARGKLRGAPVAPATHSQQDRAQQIEDITSFYRDLARDRAKTSTRPAEVQAQRSEYIESYRHLREHGNAVLILVAEAILALALMYAAGPVTAVLIVIGWVLPATVVWPLATWLEAELRSVH
jgi:hypothetical protein